MSLLQRNPVLQTETGRRADSEVDEEATKYDQRMRIPNTDKATETEINCFTSFALSNEDRKIFRDRHTRLLEMASLHDAD